jgi:isoleucyl-tRNA synthetase
VALAVHPEETYVDVEHGGETFTLARARLAATFPDGDVAVRGERLGRELVGLPYEPLFAYRAPEGGKAYEVVAADFVTLDTGTGIVHVAPAFGEDDFRVAREQGLGFLQLIEPDGTFAADATNFAGRFCKDADADIIRDLRDRGLLLRRETYRHEYPFCPRAPDDPLIQYARRSWFIRTSTEKERVVANNAAIRWQPESIRDGRMGDFLRNNVDWAISRERWWGTPLPVWVNDATGEREAIASVAEILERNPDAFRAFELARSTDPSLPADLMVHKPWIDEVTWTRPGEPGVYRRVPEVIDCWFDAGSMPFAQWGYPHRGREEFEAAFPADFITEAIDQTRGWWNAMLQISTLLFPDRPAPHPFLSCVVLGHITDKDGLKLSKRRKNYVPPMETIEHYGADAVRWALLSSSVPGQGTRFHEGVAKDATRDLLLKIWNVYSFFATYARIDAWDARAARPPVAERATLDRWVLAELDETVRAVRAAFDALESHAAARRLQAFVDALSNWYLRRSRARFWAAGDSADKHAAFATLHEVLVDLARLLAPFTPFLAETLFQKLARPADPAAPPSVHLDSYPRPDDARRDDELRHAMGLARDLVALGLQVRATEKIRVRQPLGEAILVLGGGRDVERFRTEIAEELNVKSVRVTDEPGTYVQFELVPNFKALGPRLGKRMPICKQVLQKADGSALHAELERRGAIAIDLPDGERLDLSRDEIEIRLRAREGYAAASHGDQVVILDTRITPELRREGLAREVVHHIQAARKSLDLPYEARIEVTWSADAEVAEAITRHADYIAGETLAVRLHPGEVASDAHGGDVEGEPLRFAIARAS